MPHENDPKPSVPLMNLDTIGTQKDPLVTHPQHRDVQALIHKMSRAVMRNVRPEILEQLHALHQMIKTAFINMPDASIQWLIGGATDARGSFKDAASFKKFFERAPETISSSRLITALTTLTCAIAYRSIDADWCVHPNIPADSSEERLMYDHIHRLFDGCQFPSIQTAYTLRSLDDLTCNEQYYPPDNLLTITADETSDASDVEYEEEKKSKRLLPYKTYRISPDPNSAKLSWPAAAAVGNIPIRAHVSGTIPLELAIIQRLYQSNGLTWFNNEDNIRQFSGATLLPAYTRGDFHSLAESTASLEYFIDHMNRIRPEIFSPHACLMMGLCYMTSAAHPDIQAVLQGTTNQIAAQTREIPFIVQPTLDECLSILNASDDTHLVYEISSHAIQLLKQATLPLSTIIGYLQEMHWINEQRGSSICLQIQSQLIDAARLLVQLCQPGSLTLDELDILATICLTNSPYQLHDLPRVFPEFEKHVQANAKLTQTTYKKTVQQLKSDHSTAATPSSDAATPCEDTDSQADNSPIPRKI